MSLITLQKAARYSNTSDSSIERFSGLEPFVDCDLHSAKPTCAFLMFDEESDGSTSIIGLVI